MCTVTIVPLSGGVRIVCNRDEQRTRPAALPPRIHGFGARRAIVPIDPTGGGTWVGINDAGLALILLNVNLPQGRAGEPVPSQSRGAIIPALLHHETVAQALAQARQLDSGLYAPFRLLMIDRTELTELLSNGANLLSIRHGEIREPMMWTSSGLGDHLVDPPRRALFQRMLQGPHTWVTQQTAYHRHSWPEQPELSVCMRRSDARTVSQTLIERGPQEIHLAYHPEAPDIDSDLYVVTLPLLERGV